MKEIIYCINVKEDLKIDVNLDNSIDLFNSLLNKFKLNNLYFFESHGKIKEFLTGKEFFDFNDCYYDYETGLYVSKNQLKEIDGNDFIKGINQNIFNVNDGYNLTSKYINDFYELIQEILLKDKCDIANIQLSLLKKGTLFTK